MSVWIVGGRVYIDHPDALEVPDGEYLTLEEYGESYGIKQTTLRKMIERGQIKSIKLSQRCYIAAGEMPKKRRLSLQRDRV